MGGIKLNNNRSVKFSLDSFAVPIIKQRQKNTIYTENVQNLNPSKYKLTQSPVVNNYGYVCTAQWRNYIFAGGPNGIYVADESLQFVRITQYFVPVKMFVKNNRMFAVNASGGFLYYTVDLTGEWNAASVMTGLLYIPNEFGKCMYLSAYKNDLLLICEKVLAAVDKNLNLKFLTDDNEIVLNNMAGSGTEKIWTSDFFGLGYATDTQHLREVFLKTSAAMTLFVISNNIEKVINVQPNAQIQKIKTNLRGDMFKLKIVFPSNTVSLAVSNVSAVISYGIKGE
jgi:hypothetical protein